MPKELYRLRCHDLQSMIRVGFYNNYDKKLATCTLILHAQYTEQVLQGSLQDKSFDVSVVAE